MTQATTSQTELDIFAKALGQKPASAQEAEPKPTDPPLPIEQDMIRRYRKQESVGAMGGISRGVARGTIGFIEGMARQPAAAASAVSRGGSEADLAIARMIRDDPRETPINRISSALRLFVEPVLSYIRDTSNKRADLYSSIRESRHLAPDPASVIEGQGWDSVKEAMESPEWWQNQAPELITSTAMSILIGGGMSKAAAVPGMSQQAARQFGFAVAAAMTTASEMGGTYKSMRDDLIEKGVPKEEAEIVAGRGAVAYGIIAGVLERGILPHQFTEVPGKGFWAFTNRVLRGGAGEMFEEDSQMFLEGVTRLVAGLDHGITPRGAFESTLAGGLGGGVGASVTTFSGGDADASKDIEQNISDALNESAPDTAADTTTEVDVTEAIEGMSIEEKRESSAKIEELLEQDEADRAEGSDVPLEDRLTDDDRSNWQFILERIEVGIAADEAAAAADESVKPKLNISEKKRADKGQAAADEQRSPRLSEKPTDTLRRLGIVPSKERATITDRQALRASLSRQQTTARQVELATRKTERAKAKAAINEVKRFAKDREARLNGLRAELVDITERLLPKEIQGEMLKDVRDIKTRPGLERAIEKIQGKLETLARKDAVSQMKTAAKSAKPKTMLTPERKKAVEELLEKVEAYDTKDGSTDGMTELANGLAELVAANDREQRAIILGKKVELQKLKKALIAEISKLKKRKVDPSDDRLESLRGTKILDAVASVESHATMDTLGIMVGETFRKVIYENVVAGQDAQEADLAKFQDFIISALKSAGMAPGTPAWARINKTTGNLYKRWTRLRFPGSSVQTQKFGDQKVKLDLDQRMHLFATLLDKSTMAAVVDTENEAGEVKRGTGIVIEGQDKTRTIHLSDQDIATIMSDTSFLTEAERGYVRKVVEYMNGPLKKLIADWSLANLGRDITKDDTYFPRASLKDGDPIPFGSSKLMDVRMLEQASVIQRRSGPAGPVIIGSFVMSTENHARKTTAVAHMSEAIDTATRLLESISPELNNVKRGQRLVRRVLMTFDTLAEHNIGAKKNLSFWEPAVRFVANNITSSLLIVNPRIAAYQYSSIAAAESEISSIYLSRAIATGAIADKRIDDRINRYSPPLRARAAASGQYLVHEGADSDVGLHGVHPKRQIGFAWIHAVDAAAIRTIWKAAEFQATKETGKINGDEYFTRVAEIANRVVRRTQPTFDPLHVSGLALESRAHGSAKIVNAFRSQRSKHIDIAIRSTIQMSRGQMSRRRWVATMTNVFVLSSITVASIASLFDWDNEDEKEDRLKALAQRVAETAASNVLFGDMAATILSALVFRGSQSHAPAVSPHISFIEGAQERARGLIDSMQREEDIEDMLPKIVILSADLAAIWVGNVPLYPIREGMKVYKHVREKDTNAAKRRQNATLD